jgi:23S rRNA pseudouridine1911/1915/1917 synthase
LPPNRVLPSPTHDTSLLVWLLDALQPMNRTRVKQLLHSGRVAVNNTPTTRHDHPLRPGDRITIDNDHTPHGDAKSEPKGIAIIWMDHDLVAIDKPTGLLSVATDSEKLDTAFTRLQAHLASQKAGRPFVLHRLDRETSGILLFARRAEIRDQLLARWDQVTKTYLAVLEGKPKADEGTIENWMTEGKNLRVRASNHSGANAKRAVTRYRVIARKDSYSLVEVVLETGRKHQIRVHMAGLGCPVIGDEMYRATTNPAGRLGLHAWRLAFDHPTNGKRVELESSYPEKLKDVVQIRG